MKDVLLQQLGGEGNSGIWSL